MLRSAIVLKHSDLVRRHGHKHMVCADRKSLQHRIASHSVGNERRQHPVSSQSWCQCYLTRVNRDSQGEAFVCVSQFREEIQMIRSACESVWAAYRGDGPVMLQHRVAYCEPCGTNMPTREDGASSSGWMRSWRSSPGFDTGESSSHVKVQTPGTLAHVSSLVVPHTGC